MDRNKPIPVELAKNIFNLARLHGLSANPYTATSTRGKVWQAGASVLFNSQAEYKMNLLIKKGLVIEDG